MKETIRRNMLVALFREESIKTTLTKAKEIKSLVDRIINIAKKGTLVSRRRVSGLIKDKNIQKKLFTDIANRFTDRNSGFVRLIHSGFRKGDCAQLAILELTEKRLIKKTKEEKKKEKEEKKKLLKR